MLQALLRWNVVVVLPDYERSDVTKHIVLHLPLTHRSNLLGNWGTASAQALGYLEQVYSVIEVIYSSLHDGTELLLYYHSHMGTERWGGAWRKGRTGESQQTEWFRTGWAWFQSISAWQ